MHQKEKRKRTEAYRKNISSTITTNKKKKKKGSLHFFLLAVS